MKFEEALEAMRNGKNVRRKDAYIRIHHSKNEFTDDNNQTVVLTPRDLIKDDWELVECN
jgi:hypothetical protein